MRPTQEREINGATYRSTPIPARRAASIAARIARIIGPGIVALAGAEESLKAGAAKLAEIASVAAQRLAEQLDDKVVVQLLLDILQCTNRTMDGRKDEVGRPEVFDVVYAGNFGEMLEAIVFAFEANRFFGSSGTSGFLERLSNLAERAGFRLPEATSTQTSPPK